MAANRKDLLDKVGAKPPTTVDEMKQVCAKIKALPEASSMGCYAPRPQVVKYGDVTMAIQDAAYASLQGQATPQQSLADLQKRLEGVIK